MNQVVVALVGMWWFKEPTNTANVASIAMGLVAGLLFVFAKVRAFWNVDLGCGSGMWISDRTMTREQSQWV